jgi:hypothetical protein
MSANDKLTRLKTQRLNNETHFRFHTENISIFESRYNPAALGIAQLIDPYRIAVNNEDIALEQIRKSAETERIVVADQEFDSTYIGMESYARVCLNHYDAIVRTAAENVNVVFRHYGNIGKRPYREELAASYNLMQDLRERQSAVDVIGLEPWMQAHETAASTLAELLDARTGEIAQQTDLKVLDMRRQTDSCYQQIIDRIDAMINLNGRDFVPGFFAEYNAHATEYKNTLARHLGRVRKKTEKTSEE